MKIEIELYGASKDFSSENIIKLDLKNNSRIKDLRNELIKFKQSKLNTEKLIVLAIYLIILLILQIATNFLART